MIVYLDASALVKCYVHEAGSQEVMELVRLAEMVGTAVISRAEVSAALAKAVRVGSLPQEEAEAALNRFVHDWANLVRVQITETLVASAASLAWKRNLRGYDAVHLAAAITWREALQEPVTLAVYDRDLWRSASEEGFSVFPNAL